MALPDINMRPSTRSIVVPRRVPDPGKMMRPEIAGQGFGDIAAAFDKFATKLSAEEEAQAILQDKENLAALALSVNQRPDEAVSAINSGDYSAFATEIQMGRIGFASQAPLIIADSLAIKEATAFKSVLDNLPLNDNGQAATKQYVTAAVKNFPPRAALTFTNTFNKAIAKPLKERKTYLETIAVANLKGNMDRTLKQKAINGTITNLNDISEVVQATAFSVGNGVSNLLELQQNADAFVARMSAHEDLAVSTRFTTLLYKPDPSRAGSSVASRLGDAEIAKLQQEQTKSHFKRISVNMERAINLAKERLAEVKVGRARPGVNPASILRALDSTAEAEGLRPGNPKYSVVRTQIIKEFDHNSNVRAGLQATSGEDQQGRTDKELNDRVDYLTNQAISKGGSGASALVHPNIIQAFSFNPTTSKLKTRLDNLLRVGKSNDFDSVRLFIQAAMQVGGQSLSKFISDPTSLALYKATENASVQDALNIRKLLLDGLQERNGNYKNALWETHQSNALFDSKVTKKDVYPKMAEAVFGNEELLKTFNLPEGLTLDRMDAALKGQSMRALMDIATVAAVASGNASVNAIAEKFLGLFKDDFEIGVLGTEGVPLWSKRKSPTLVQGPGNTVQRSGPITPDIANKFAKLLDEAGLNQILGFRTDAATRLDGTVLMMVNAGYGMQPFRVPVNKPLVLDDKLLGELGLDGQFLVSDRADRPGMVQIEAKPPRENESNVLRINPVAELRYQPENQTWELRRSIGPDYAAIKRGDEKAIQRAVGFTSATVRGLTTAVNAATERGIDELATSAKTSLKDNPYRDLDEKDLTEQLKSLRQADLSTLGTAGSALSRSFQVGKPKNKNDPTSPTPEELSEIIKQVEEALMAKRAIRQLREQEELFENTIPAALNENDPRTLTVEQLQRELDRIKSATGPTGSEEGTAGQQYTAAQNQFRFRVLNEELAKRKTDPFSRLDATSILPLTMLPGAGIAIQSLDIPQRQSYNKQRRADIQDAIQDGVRDNTYHPAAVGATRKARNLAEAHDIALRISRLNGHNPDTINNAEKMTPFMNRVVDFIEASESFMSTATTITGPSTSQKRIGFGFRLNTEDADLALKAAGTTRKKVEDGETITEEQANIITNFVVGKQETWLKTKFKGYQLKKHQKMALHSLLYSSEWEKGNPILFGPQSKLMFAIISGNFQQAARIIRNTALSGRLAFDQTISEQQAFYGADGLAARRRREADMFVGTDSLLTD